MTPIPLDPIRHCIDRADPVGLLRSLADVAAHVDPGALVELGLEHALARSQGRLRGSRWTHALLSLGWAAGLHDQLGRSVGLPAAVGALHFLVGSEPGVAAPMPAEAPPDRGALLRSAAAVGLGGWGRHLVVASTLGRLAELYPGDADALRLAAASHWTPPEPRPTVGAEATVLAEQALGALLDEGREEALAEATVTLACRIVVGTPRPRQVASLGVARAAVDAVAAGAREVAAPVARFVVEGWRLAVGEGRARRTLDQLLRDGPPPPGSGLRSLACVAARRELTQTWGVPLQVTLDALTLCDRLPAQGARWLAAAVEVYAATWPAWERPWRSVSGRGQHV